MNTRINLITESITTLRNDTIRIRSTEPQIRTTTRNNAMDTIEPTQQQKGEEEDLYFVPSDDY
jgi:hypothetical protein